MSKHFFYNYRKIQRVKTTKVFWASTETHFGVSHSNQEDGTYKLMITRTNSTSYLLLQNKNSLILKKLDYNTSL